MNPVTRKYTVKLLEMADEGAFRWQEIAEMALRYMSEDDVQDMCQYNDLETYMFAGEGEDA